MAAMKDQVHHQVLITRTISVKPRSPQAHRSLVLRLSNLDRKCPMLMYLVFFYRSPPPPPHQELSQGCSLFNSIKMGLEKALLAWYPASGRLFQDPSTKKLDLVCNNFGALLVEASTSAKISDLGDLSQYNEFLESLVYRPPSSGDLSAMPLVVAQVTRFACGGYAMGVGTNHSLFDGLANYNFLRAWASKTSGKECEDVELVMPVHERERLLVGHGQQKLGNSDGKGHATRVMAFDHLHLLIKQVATNQCMEKGINSKGEDFVLRTFTLSHEMVERLKKKVTSGMSSNGACSSFEVVAAHLWKARTKALGIAKDRTVCLQFAVDTRPRLSPPLPPAFAGNAYVLASISRTAAELDADTLLSIINFIKQAKAAVTDTYVGVYLKALEHPEAASTELPPIPELTIVSDWTRTPYHLVDFGLGPASYVSPLMPPVPQVAYFMQGPDDDGAMHVRIGLRLKHVHAFGYYFMSRIT